MSISLQPKLLRFARPSFICLLIYLAYILVILGGHDWNPDELIRIGGHFDPRVGGQQMGYDGQFAYQIARDPLNGWQYVDLPAYRYQRILYPMLCLLLSFGNGLILPWNMLLINLFAVVLGVSLLEKILTFYDQSRWPALGYGLFIGTLISVRLCLNEPLAYALVLGGIWMYIQGKIPLAGVYFALAVLTKEITILFVIAIGIHILHRRFRDGVLFGTIAILPFLLWKIALFEWFHDWGMTAGGAMSTSFEWMPFAGWWKLAAANLPGFLTISVLIVPLVILPSILAIIQCIRQIIRRQWNESTSLLLFTAILIPFLPSSNILDPLGVSRALMGLVIAWLVYGAQNQSRRTLSFCYLFAFSGLFIWKDTFLPVGTFSRES
jgi:hypothetical protein